MPLTKKGKEVMASMRETYGGKKKIEQVFYASKNKGKLTGVDAAKFRGALRRGASLDSAMQYSAIEEDARTAGTGVPLVPELAKCIRDAAKEGGSPSEVLSRAMDKRITFQGGTSDAPGQPAKPSPPVKAAKPAKPTPAAKPAKPTLTPPQPAKPATPTPAAKPSVVGKVSEAAGTGLHGVARATGVVTSGVNHFTRVLGLVHKGIHAADSTGVLNVGETERIDPVVHGPFAVIAMHLKERHHIRDELFAAKSNGIIEKMSYGDRKGVMDAMVNRLRGRRLGNKRNPMVKDAFNESAHPRNESGQFGSGGGHGVDKVEPTKSGARYHVGNHQLEISKKGSFVSHTKSGMTGSYDPKISKNVFPQIHNSVKAHLKEHGPHPEAGSEVVIKRKSFAGSQIKSNASASAKVKRMF